MLRTNCNICDYLNGLSVTITFSMVTDNPNRIFYKFGMVTDNPN